MTFTGRKTDPAVDAAELAAWRARTLDELKTRFAGLDDADPGASFSSITLYQPPKPPSTGAIAAGARTVLMSGPDEGAPASADSTGPAAGTSEDAPPESLGDWQIIEKLAEGGMGIIWRARQDALAREIAVKSVRPGIADDESRARFLDEAVVTGALEHPNIAPVYSLARNEAGEVQLAMKLIGGRSWATLRAEDGPDLDRDLDILLTVCSALRYAHEQGGILHRDLKPENIMLGEYGEVLVMDWGLACSYRPPADGSPRLGVPTELIGEPGGTPAYMAPEMAEVRPDDLGPWTDVFLLGGILLEVLGGSPPNVDPEQPDEKVWNVLLRAVARPEPQIPEDAPSGLAAIVRAALEADVTKRTASVREFRESIEAWRRRRAALKLLARAESLLAEARRSGAYDHFNRALGLAEQSLELCAELTEAAELMITVRAGKAGRALDNGDLELADSELQRLPRGHPHRLDLTVRLTMLRESRHQRRRRQGFLALASVVLLILAVREGFTTRRLQVEVEEARMRHRTAAARLFSSFASDMKDAARRKLEPAVRVLDELTRLAARDRLPLADDEALGDVLGERLRSEPTLDGLSYGDHRGRFVGALRRTSRRPDRSLMTWIDLMVIKPDSEGLSQTLQRLRRDGRRGPLRAVGPGFDARRRPWYEVASARAGSAWTSPYVFSEGDPGLTHCRGLRRDGAVAGVFAADFRLDQLERFLATLAPGERSDAWLLTPAGEMVVAAAGRSREQSRRRLERRLELDPQALAEPDHLRVAARESDRTPVLVGFESFQVDGGLALIVGMEAPLTDLGLLEPAAAKGPEGLSRPVRIGVVLALALVVGVALLRLLRGPRSRAGGGA